MYRDPEEREYPTAMPFVHRLESADYGRALLVSQGLEYVRVLAQHGACAGAGKPIFIFADLHDCASIVIYTPVVKVPVKRDEHERMIRKSPGAPPARHTQGSLWESL